MVPAKLFNYIDVMTQLKSFQRHNTNPSLPPALSVVCGAICIVSIGLISVGILVLALRHKRIGLMNKGAVISSRMFLGCMGLGTLLNSCLLPSPNLPLCVCVCRWTYSSEQYLLEWREEKHRWQRGQGALD